MSWTAFPWLAGLLPWTVVVCYLLIREHAATVTVPHLRLWREGAGTGRRAVVRRRPRLAILLGLLATLCGVIAAGGPRGRGGSIAVVVVLDRGVTMAPAAGGRPFRGVVDRARRMLGRRPAHLVCVPPDPGSVGGADADWAARADRVAPTAADTSAALEGTIASLLWHDGDAPIVVLTDRPLHVRGRRVVRVDPSEPIAGVGIVTLAARERPSAQVMVRLVNRSGRSAATLRVASAETAIQRTVALPPAGGSAAVFIDLPRLGPTVTAAIDPAEVDGRAWLARQGDAMDLMATPGVPTALRRMVDVFNQGEGGGSGRRVVVSDRPLPPGQPGVWVVGTEGHGGSIDGPATVVAHPVTAGVVEWAGDGATAPAGFTAVVARSGRALVAVREGRARQVWAALDVARAARSADWVVFLASAFRWVGGGEPQFTASSPRRLGEGWERVDDGPAPDGAEAGWWPGLYRSADGRTIAVNAAMPIDGAAEPRAADAVVPPAQGTAWGRPLAGPLSILAVGCLAMAAALWPVQRRG